MYQRILKNMNQFRGRMEELVKEAKDSYTDGEVGLTILRWDRKKVKTIARFEDT